jgi:hypothetical protein
MKSSAIHRALGGIFFGAMVCLPSAAQACSACMGDVNSKTAGAINAAIFLMIGVLGTMLASLGGFAFYLSRRAAAPTPPHAELGQNLNDPEDFS